MAKVIKTITQEVTTNGLVSLVVTNCSPYGKEGDIIEVNASDAESMVSKGFANYTK